MWKSDILRKIQADDLHLYLKCHSSTGAFKYFCCKNQLPDLLISERLVGNGLSSFNPLSECCPHIETSQLICTTNQLTGFYMRATLAPNGLKAYFKNISATTLFLRVMRLNKYGGILIIKCVCFPGSPPNFRDSYWWSWRNKTNSILKVIFIFILRKNNQNDKNTTHKTKKYSISLIHLLQTTSYEYACTEAIRWSDASTL